MPSKTLDQPPARSKAGQVLLVEDEAPARRMLSTALRSLGFSVVPVSDAGSALAALDDELPDLIVVDVRLPDATGIELIEKLRDRPATSQLPMLLMSAYERPRGHKADRFLPKPFELSHFERVVRELSKTA